MAFLTSLESILSIILIILLGYILKEKKWFDDSFSNNISKLIMKKRYFYKYCCQCKYYIHWITIKYSAFWK